MIDPPKRTGYCLTYDAELLYDNWRDIGGCSCHTGCTPCSSCHNEGHPISLEENDEAWELDRRKDMARDNIIDKGGTQPPEYESEYDPDTAQPTRYTAHVVFKQDFGEYGGRAYSYVCSREDYAQWVGYRALDEDVFAVVKVSGVMLEKKVKVLRIEAKVDPKATKSIVRILPKDVDTEIQKSKIDIVPTERVGWTLPPSLGTNNQLSFSITKEENIMSNQNRVVSVKFFDDDAGLKAEDSLVASYEVVTRTTNEMTVSKVLLTEDVAGKIAAHNEKRENTIDQHIRKQTGNEVYLLPVEFEDLRVVVSNV